MKTLFLTLFVAHQKPLIFELLHYCWSSKLCYDILFQTRCSSDIPLLLVCLQHVLVVTILLLLLALSLLVLAVLAAENAVSLSCGLCHMCCCVSHARLFGSTLRSLRRMLSCALPLQMAFLAPKDHVFFQFLLMCVRPSHAVPMKYVLFISFAVRL